ncbi:DGQHR domain-containing protein [Planosporangium thailandense]|uniref:DGQHR domain-containing protein n=1 Tax=Planosporangium thailandense TaxID=765197 RepID=A0ABX0Y066_9ACTN|nr:DGQHR domain-containing protein DpdB [Planosporangium thailandense]NJC70854.1 DGQHR domain-containing protein [Planosporangium thailandense]
MGTRASAVLSRRAVRITQSQRSPLYLFSLTAREILEVADISRVSRDKGGKLIGYQRREVRQHVQEIVDYLDGDDVLFPNSIIIALPSSVKFVSSRGLHVSDGVAVAGSIEIPLPQPNEPKPGWIVDGQQRALALARCKRDDFPVPVNAFVADSVDLQRDQFVRVNNSKPLPRGLVTELLPAIDTPLPPRLSLRQTPSALCELLNQANDSPFEGLIKRPSTGAEERRSAVITDTSIINMLEESLKSSAGCLFPYRNLTSGETDFGGVWACLVQYWSAVRDTFPGAWGKAPTQSRLMHGTGIRAMGRLMDRIMATVDPQSADAPRRVREELALIAPYCRWTEGTWEALGMRWNDLENVPRHLNELSNFLIRTHIQARSAAQRTS